MVKNQFTNVFLILVMAGKTFSFFIMILFCSKRSVNAYLPIMCKRGSILRSVVSSKRVTTYKNTNNKHDFRPVITFESRMFSTSHLSSGVLGTYGSADNSTISGTAAYSREAKGMTKLEQLRQVANEKKNTRRKNLEMDRQRNLELKRLIYDDNNQASTSLIAVKVSVDDSLRRSLAMNGREKRGRMFLRQGPDNCTTSIADFKQELHGFFRTLKRKSYVLRAALPSQNMNSSSEAICDNDIVDDNTTTWWPLETDEHVVQMLERTNEFFLQHQKQLNSSTDLELKDVLMMKRPTFLLRVSQDPNYVPASKPTYLDNMPDPLDSKTMTMISFYSFFPIEDEVEYVSNLKRVWKPFHVLGRVYVAKEGINAQMAIPTNVLAQFRQSLVDVIPEAATNTDIVNVDPIPLDKSEFYNESKSPPPFTNLHIRIRPQIVADGLPLEPNNTTVHKPLDLYGHSTGIEMSPLEWHQNLLSLQNQRNAESSQQPCHQEQRPILLDCRNKYETDVGTFVGAEPLNTEFFRESWDVLKDRLKDTPKDAPILTYCTGGIRCVKVGAYLTQELGFQNVSRLAGGIIAYDRALLEENKNKVEQEQKKSLFIGTNYVFDNRVGRQITNDALGTCITCGGKTNLVSNCRNNNCHKRMVQCLECSSKYIGTCSEACRQRVLNSQGNMIARKRSAGQATGSANTSAVSEEEDYDVEKETPCHTLDQYSTVYSSDLPPIYAAIEHNTNKYLPTGSHMVSGSMQGRLLCNLASMTTTGRILEIGTFTGYATASLLEGAAANRNPNILGTRTGGPFILSLERDQRAYDLAVAHLNILSRLGIGAEAAAEILNIDMEHIVHNLKNPHSTFTFAFKNIIGCEIQRVSDALATIEQMALGEGFNADIAPFDIVFIDADKTRLLEYTEACLANDRILKKGGFMIVDNTLYKGIVLEHTGVSRSPVEEDNDPISSTMDSGKLKRSRRAYQLAGKMHKFNKEIAGNNRCEVMILPIRDGLSLIRKK